MKDKYYRVRAHYHYPGGYRGALHIICNLKHSILKKIDMAIHNGYNYDHLDNGYNYDHFIIKELAEEF